MQDYTYPTGTENHADHKACPINLAGTHKGNRYCTKHQVRVAAPQDKI